MPYSKWGGEGEVSVVVCHHTGDLIFDLIKSIRVCRIPLQIIVISSDENIDTAKLGNCLVYHSTAGPAEKRNIGVRLATAPYVVFFDDDVEIEVNCIENMLFSLKANSHLGMVYGKLHNFERKDRFDEAGSFITPTGFLWSRAEQNLVDVGQYDMPENILAGKSASCMVRKSVFNEVGGFDEDFYILGEETDLSWRMWLKGYPVGWVPSSYAEHKFNTKYKPIERHYTSERVQFNGCRNYITMLFKNLGVANLWKILPLHILIWFGAGIAMVITGKVKPGANILKGIWYCLVNWRLLYRKRKGVQGERELTDDELWPIISRTPGRSYYTERFWRYLSQGLHG